MGHVCVGLFDWEVGSGLTECWPQGVVLSGERAEKHLLGRTRELCRGVLHCTPQRTTLGFHNNKQGTILRKKVLRHTSKDVKNRDTVLWSGSRFDRALQMHRPSRKRSLQNLQVADSLQLARHSSGESQRRAHCIGTAEGRRLIDGRSTRITIHRWRRQRGWAERQPPRTSHRQGRRRTSRCSRWQRAGR